VASKAGREAIAVDRSVASGIGRAAVQRVQCWRPTGSNRAFADPLAKGMTQFERERSFEKVFSQIVRRISILVELPRYTTAVPAETALIACC
jgi:hypothetical protein